MRILCLALVTAGAIFAQAPVPFTPPASGQFYPPPMRTPGNLAPLPLWRPSPLVPFTLPGAQAPVSLPLTQTPVGAYSPSRCAVPLLEMTVSPDIDSIARTPAATGDRIAVTPPVLSCSDVTTAAADAYAAEGLKHLQKAREKLKEWKEAQPATPPVDTTPAPK